MGRTGREGDAEMALRSLRRWPQMQEAIEITGISGATVSEVDGGSRWPTVAPEIRSSVISATWVSVRGHRHGGSTVAPTVAHGGHGGPFGNPSICSDRGEPGGTSGQLADHGATVLQSELRDPPVDV